jgi:hypothetical protein
VIECPDADGWGAEVAKSRQGKIAHLDFLADLKQLLAKHGYTMAPEFNRIVVHDRENRAVCSFRDIDDSGPRDLKFGSE